MNFADKQQSVPVQTCHQRTHLKSHNHFCHYILYTHNYYSDSDYSGRTVKASRRMPKLSSVTRQAAEIMSESQATLTSDEHLPRAVKNFCVAGAECRRPGTQLLQHRNLSSHE